MNIVYDKETTELLNFIDEMIQKQVNYYQNEIEEASKSAIQISSGEIERIQKLMQCDLNRYCALKSKILSTAIPIYLYSLNESEVE